MFSLDNSSPFFSSLPELKLEDYEPSECLLNTIGEELSSGIIKKPEVITEELRATKKRKF